MEFFKQNKNNKIFDLEKSFYNSEMVLQDQLATPFVNNKLPAVNPSFVPSDPAAFQNLLNKVRAIPNTAVPATNPYLGNRTFEEYKDYTTPEGIGNVVPLLRKLGSRAYKLGEQYVDNIPGLSSLGENSEDESLGTAGALIQAGGRVLPLAGTFWFGINAGPTAAGTLDEARRRGYTR
jgi:hypothetical protein